MFLLLLLGCPAQEPVVNQVALHLIEDGCDQAHRCLMLLDRGRLVLSSDRDLRVLEMDWDLVETLQDFSCQDTPCEIWHRPGPPLGCRIEVHEQHHSRIIDVALAPTAQPA